MKTPLPLPLIPATRANYSELWARLLFVVLLVAGLGAGIASRWTP